MAGAATLRPSLSGGGSDVVAADGATWTYGDAVALPSLASLHLAQPVVGGAATPRHRGGWLAAADGGVLAVGAAPLPGSAGGMRPNPPVGGIAAPPRGGGSWPAPPPRARFAPSAPG